MANLVEYDKQGRIVWATADWRSAIYADAEAFRRRERKRLGSANRATAQRRQAAPPMDKDARNGCIILIVILAIIVLVSWAGCSACGDDGSTDPSTPTSTGQTTLATLTGPDMPASTDQATFNANMAVTPVFHVDGSVTITARVVSDDPSVPGVVEGYLVPAGVPSSIAPDSLDAMQFDLTGESIGTSQSWSDLSGDYYVMAAGQDCTWSLDVTE